LLALVPASQNDERAFKVISKTWNKMRSVTVTLPRDIITRANLMDGRYIIQEFWNQDGAFVMSLSNLTTE
jgi:hypothetical protein